MDRAILHPAFDTLRALGAIADLERAACARDLQSVLDRSPHPVLNDKGMAIRLVDAAPDGAAAYERNVLDRGELAVDAAGWHDRFNVAAWRMFPRSKATLNARHVADLAAGRPGMQRSRLRDALTLFDEEGVVVAVADDGIEPLVRAFQWKQLFWDRRQTVASRAAFVPFGHGLLEKLMAPFIGLTAKAVFVPVPESFFARPWSDRQDCLDTVASRIIGGLAVPADLAPLPVLGIPGWWPGNERSDFYDDRNYFRPGRRRVSYAAVDPTREHSDHGP